MFQNFWSSYCKRLIIEGLKIYQDLNVSKWIRWLQNREETRRDKNFWNAGMEGQRGGTRWNNYIFSFVPSLVVSYFVSVSGSRVS